MAGIHTEPAMPENVTLKCRLVPFVKERAPEVAAQVAPFLKADFEVLPADKRDSSVQTLLSMWAKNEAALVVQFDGDAVRGVGILMTMPSILHDMDCLCIFFSPAEGAAAQMVDMLQHVAMSRGATGISMNITANPLGFAHIEALASAGWKAKATTYGRSL